MKRIRCDLGPNTLEDGNVGALANNKCQKKCKGEGNRKTGYQSAQVDNSAKECYGRGKAGHIGADCPERKAGVAASGPERVPGKGKGLKGNGKGK